MKKIWFSLLCISLHANPVRPNVRQGSATFSSPAPDVLEITASHKAVINWHSFSIESAETTRFIQPSASSTILNRVVGVTPTSILGTLQANGRIVLINPNGILIGSSGQVSVAGIMASTLKHTDSNFMDDTQDKLFVGTSPYSIVNQGTITASNGDAILIAGAITNDGTISAPMGLSALAQGHKVLVKPSGTDRIVISPTLNFGGSPSPLENNGVIHGLEVQLHAAGSSYGLALNRGSLIEATSITKRGGKVLLVADEGVIQVDGTVYAAKAFLRGKTIDIQDHATIDASSKLSGGEIYIGGSLQNKDPLFPLSETVSVSEGAQILASALKSGRGGTIVLYSKNFTSMRGKVQAHGGPEGGNGGVIEISSQGQLAFPGKITTLAPHGQTGKLFLDPSTIFIDAGPTSPGPFTPVYDPASVSVAHIAAGDISSALMANDVIISTSSGTGGTGDITQVAGNPISWATTHSLTLNAAENGSINVFDQISCSSTGNVTLIAGKNIQVGQLGQVNDSFVQTIGSITVRAEETLSIIGDATFDGGLQAGDIFDVTAKEIILTSSNDSAAVLWATGMTGNPSFITTTQGGLSLLPHDMAVAFIEVDDADLRMNIHGDLNMIGNNIGQAFIIVDGDIHATIVGNQNIIAQTSAISAIQSGSSLYQNIGGNVLIQNNDSSSGAFTVAFTPAGGQRSTIGGSLTVYNPSVVISGTAGFNFMEVTIGTDLNLQLNGTIVSGQGPIFLSAGKDIRVGPGGTISLAGLPLPGTTITLIVDAAHPKAPFIGSGSFIVDPASNGINNGAPFFGAPPPPVPIRIFTARRSQNTIGHALPFDLQPFHPGAKGINNAHERWGDYYPNVYFGPFFALFYKEPQISAREYNTIFQVFGNAYDTLSYPNTELMPYNQKFCMIKKGGSPSCFIINVDNYRRRPRAPESNF